VTNVAISVILSCCYITEETDTELVTIFVERELFLCATVVVLLHTLETNILASARQRIAVLSAAHHRLAVASLLRMVCDAVVELDADLNLVEDCPALSNALFRAKGKSLQGLPLKQFFFLEDEGQLEELRSLPSATSAASAPSAALVTAKMLHVRLRDSWGNSVPFELFHVPFKSLGDDMRHLVGLREHGDYQDGRRGTEGSPAVCEAPGGAPAELHEAAPAIATLDEAATSVRSSESEDSLSSIGSASSVVGKDDAHMQIDVVVCDALPTKYLSRNFMDEFGQHKCFAECIFEPTRFVDWLMATADAVCGGSQLPQVRTFGELCIRGGSHAQVIERMAPALLLPSGGCEDGARSAVAGSLKVLAL